MKRDLLSFALWTREQLAEVFDLSRRLKALELSDFRPLHGKAAALVFEKESLRTRVAFEVGVSQLGGHPIFLQQEAIGLATRESVHDIGQVLSQYAHLIVARTVRHQTCVQLAQSSSVPVINAMTDLLHPCQILADVFTLQELGKFSPSTKIVFVGDGNNIVNNSNTYGYNLPVMPSSNHGVIRVNSSCNSAITYCGPSSSSQKLVFDTNDGTIDQARVRME